MTKKSNNALWLAAAKAKHVPKLLGWYLARYQDRHGYSDDAIMSLLDGSPSGYPRLALCGRPNMDEGRFRQDVEAISTYSGVNASKLARLVREVVAFDSLESYIPQQTLPSSSFLAAARDKDNGGKDDAGKDDQEEKKK